MKDTLRRVVIVGAGYAGVLCAARLRRTLCKVGRDASIAVVDPRTHFVERVRLHEDAASGKLRPRVPLERMLGGMRVELEHGSVRDVDLHARRLRIEDGRTTRTAAFDDLVIATGSSRTGEDIPGVREHTFSVATEEDTLTLMARLDRTPSARVVVCGGGLTGIELATELAERQPSLHVTLVTSSSLAPSLSEKGRAHVRAALVRLGVTLLESACIVAVEDRAIGLEEGNVLPADVVVWCTGLRASRLAGSIGLAVDAHGRALVDEQLRSRSHPFVRVAGDAARFEVPLGDGGTRPLRMACATAIPMGAFCADDLTRDIAGLAPRPFRFSYLLQCASLGRRDAVVQHVDPEDMPRPLVIRRLPAAWVKEALCRFAAGASALERFGVPVLWLRRRPLLPAPEVTSPS